MYFFIFNNGLMRITKKFRKNERGDRERLSMSGTWFRKLKLFLSGSLENNCCTTGLICLLIFPLMRSMEKANKYYHTIP